MKTVYNSQSLYVFDISVKRIVLEMIKLYSFDVKCITFKITEMDNDIRGVHDRPHQHEKRVNYKTI